MKGAHLSPSLRAEHKRRSIHPRKGDIVKIMRGDFKEEKGKVVLSDRKKGRCEIEGIERERVDGSKVRVPIENSNLLITELEHDSERKIFGAKEEKSEKKPKAKKKKTEPKAKKKVSKPKKKKSRKPKTEKKKTESKKPKTEKKVKD